MPKLSIVSLAADEKPTYFIYKCTVGSSSRDVLKVWSVVLVKVYKYRSEMHRNLANFTTIRIALHLFEPHENASPALVFTKGMVLATNHKKLAWNSKEHLPVQGYTSNQDMVRLFQAIPRC